MILDKNILRFSQFFDLCGEPKDCEKIGNGQINETYKLTTDTGREYLLQKVNSYVFTDIKGLMKNIGEVTEHIRKKDSSCSRTPQPVKTKSGTLYVPDESGDGWRVFDFIKGISVEAPRNLSDAYEIGSAFGSFLRLISDFPPEELSVTIPDFHNTIKRYKTLKDAAKADEFKRLSSCEKELDYLLESESAATEITRLELSGVIPKRVTHGDAKPDNALLDTETGKALAVLDLDTVMSGLSVLDYGDLMRSGASKVSADWKNAEIDIEMFEALTKGYLSECGSILCKAERKALPLAAFTISVELGMRYLTDYLTGDKYFKAKYETENLERCRVQLAIAADIQRKTDKINEIMKSI